MTVQEYDDLSFDQWFNKTIRAEFDELKKNAQIMNPAVQLGKVTITNLDVKNWEASCKNFPNNVAHGTSPEQALNKLKALCSRS